MSNGVAHALVEPHPVVTLKPAGATEIEVKIGAAVAGGVTAIAMAILDWEAKGAMSPSAKTWCGTVLGGLAQLRLDLLGEPLDFDEVALIEGRRALQGHPTEVVLAHLGKGRVDAITDELLHHVLAISSKVVDDELKLRAN